MDGIEIEVVGELNCCEGQKLKDALIEYGFEDTGEMNEADSAGILGVLMKDLDKFDHGFDFKQDSHNKMRDDFIRHKTYGRKRW